MTLREKVMLSLAVTAAIGGGLYSASGAFRPPGTATEVTPKDFTALIVKVQLNLEEGELTDRQERVLAAATTPWSRNPLLERPLVPQITESAPPLPKYIGFIDITSQPIAIIDGNDYRAGEAIKGGEFLLSQIYPDHIELLRHGASESIKVPLEKALTTGEPQ